MKTELFLLSTAFALLMNACSQPTEQKNEPTEEETTEAAPLSEEEQLKAAAEASPDDRAAQYNVAIFYYNQGVALIENMDYEAPFEQLKEEQNKVMELFKKAIPYAEAAHRIDSTHTNTIEMLSGIYFGVNEIDKSDHFKALLNDTTEGKVHHYNQI